MMRRLVVGGTHSGVGKTTITAGLIAALRQRGLSIQPFKVGPDYIDPTYHTLAAGRRCRNLDTWMIPPERVRSLFAQNTKEVDLSIIEGVMGIYDGFGYEEETGSTAQVAKLLHAPVVLTLDASRIARSAGALALGYQQFDPDLNLRGFIINQVGSEAHGQGIATAIEQATGLPVFGWLPREQALKIPERHLGLIPTMEPGMWEQFIAAATQAVSCYLDLDRLLMIAQETSPLLSTQTVNLSETLSPEGPRYPVVAVAQDEAFHFTYEENLELLRVAGAKTVFFSPLRDSALPPDTAAIILSGGFPEIFADRLSANTEMRKALREAHKQKIPIYAECGGLMYLTETLVDLQAQEYPMVGLLPGRSVMTNKLTLGYRLAQAVADSWLFTNGETIRGHEFHYSIWEGRPPELPPAYFLLPPNGQGEPRPEGGRLDTLWASYIHVHFWTKPVLAARFVEACAQAQTTNFTRGRE